MLEDDADLRSILNLALREEGIESVCTDDARSALLLLRATPFDVLVVDLHLPRSDGATFIREARAQAAHGSVIVLTGVPHPERTLAGIAVDAVVPKPFDLSELIALIRRHAVARPYRIAS